MAALEVDVGPEVERCTLFIDQGNLYRTEDVLLEIFTA